MPRSIIIPPPPPPHTPPFPVLKCFVGSAKTAVVAAELMPNKTPV